MHAHMCKTDGLAPFLCILINHVRACHSKEHVPIIKLNTTQQYEMDYSFRCI